MTDSDEDSIPPPPPPPPPVQGGAAEGELENLVENSSMPSSAGYGGEQIELNLDELYSPSSVLQKEENTKVSSAPTTSGRSDDGGDGCMKRNKKCLTILVCLLLCGGAIGAALGVTQPWNSTSSDESAATDPGDGGDGASPSPTPFGDYMPGGGEQTRPPTPPNPKEDVALSVLRINLPEESYEAVSDATFRTPQNDALNWVLYDDTWEYDWEGLAEDPPDADAEFDFMQRYVAATLYMVFTGANWEDNTGWLSGQDVCVWYGVTCTIVQGKGAISILKLDNNNLRGWIPPDISVLTYLEEIEFHRNRVGGELPPHLFGMTSLKTLFLDDNRIQGTVASELGNMVNLEKLTLNSNRMEGTIPTEVGQMESLNM